MTIVSADWLIAEPGDAPVRDGAVRVIGDLIDAVGPAAELRSAHPDEDEVRGGALLPGFVNAHTHLYGVLAHGIPPASGVVDFWSFLAEYWWPKVEDALDAEMIGVATDWAVAELLSGGTTTFYDILEAPYALPGVLAAQAEVVGAAGARGILSFEATERAGPSVAEAGLAENAAMLARAASDPTGLVGGASCFHTTFTCSESYVRRAVELAHETDAFVHAHVNEGHHEPQAALERFGRRTLEVYRDWGVLSDRFLASQCVQLSDLEQQILVDHDVRVSHMPLANCEVGGGIAPIPELAESGVTIGLGSDGYLNDMFQVMRGAFLVHKARRCDPGVMPANQVLSMATTGGAAALGLGDRIGRLRPGFAADLVLVEMDTPTPVHAHNLYDQLVLWRSASDVTDVMVAGCWRVRNGVLLGVDLERLRARVHEQSERLWANA